MAPEPGRNALSQRLIDWADVIIAMETIHSQYIHAHFACGNRKIYVLNIPDVFNRDDPGLKRALYAQVPEILKTIGQS